MGMLILFRSSFLAVDDSGDDASNIKNTRLVDDNVYEVGEERSCHPAHIRDTDPHEGSFVSNVSDDNHIYTTTGYDDVDDNDRHEFEQEIARFQSRETAPAAICIPETHRFNEHVFMSLTPPFSFEHILLNGVHGRSFPVE
jgi:hypothetical protein